MSVSPTSSFAPKRTLIILLGLLLIGTGLSGILYNSPATAKEKIYIDIGSPGKQQFPIALPRPRTTGQPDPEMERNLSHALTFDLALSGLFRILPPESYLESEQPSPAEDFPTWVMIGAEGLVRAEYIIEHGELSVTGRIYDTVRGQMLSGKVFTAPPDRFRLLAHQLANEVIRVFTGTPGIAGTRIAYESDRTGRKEIYISELDGSREWTITANRRINLSPAWSPDGWELLYTSYRMGNPDVYRYRLKTGISQRFIKFPGLNLGATFSPEGNEVILTLSKDQDAEIYRYHVTSGKLTRLTRNWGIDISPSFSPDGKHIAFTSSRSGNPQIYVMDANGKRQKRLTYSGSYNTSPAWSPRGDLIAFTRMEHNRFQLLTIRPDGSDETLLLADPGSHEDPCWSPDGRLIAYSSNRDGDYDIWVVNFDGSFPRRLLRTPGANESSPAWSPR